MKPRNFKASDALWFRIKLAASGAGVTAGRFCRIVLTEYLNRHDLPTKTINLKENDVE